MAQWYTQLLFKEDQFLGDSLADWQNVELSPPPDLAGLDHFTVVVVSGYALYGQLQGYYALGAARIGVDPASGRAYYLTEQSALHTEPPESLTPAQRAAVRGWLLQHYPHAWENSVDAFKKSLAGAAAAPEGEG